MGVFVFLDVLPERIDPKAWHAIYLESLALLRAWPTSILGLHEKTVGSQKLLVYSRDIEQGTDDEKRRHWKVEGDQQSRQFSETFELYANLDSYRRNSRGNTAAVEERSILENLYEMAHQVGSIVFDSKTQGRPYHEAMLAVAMLVEDAFPQAAVVSGDINLAQSRKAQGSIRTLLNRDVQCPICVDGERLFLELLRQDGEGKKPRVIERFFNAFHGDREDAILIARKHVEPEALQRFYANRMTHFPLPGTLGFRKCCMEWMNATTDLPTLMEMACVHEAGPQASPVELAQALVGIWLTMAPETIRQLTTPVKKSDEPQTIEDLLSNSSLLMMGMQGRDIRVHVPQEALLTAFQQRFPDRLEEIRQAVFETHEKLHHSLHNLTQDLDRSRTENDNPSSPSVSQPPSFNLEELRDIHSLDQLPDHLVPMLDELASAMDVAIGHLLEIQTEIATWDVKKIRMVIDQRSYDRRICLTEDAWDWMDRETDRGTLLIIFCLIFIQNDTQTFATLRSTLLEYPLAMAAIRERMELSWG